ncbi:archaeosortase A [Methanosarcinales archaeon]|nr:MAG: archaeosortase A [Methanosarcinales archaeon]
MLVFLWIAIALFGICSFTRNMKVGGIGWLFFAVHWGMQPIHYIEIRDWYNTALTILTAIFCLLISYRILKSKKEEPFLTLTKASLIGGIVYFPFAEITFLKKHIIGVVASQSVWLANMLGKEAFFNGQNMISLGGFTIEIILACTAIESMALFIGLIMAIDAEVKRKLMAFVISVPVIYTLNLFRNAIVLIASGERWLSPDPLESFYLAHAVYAKIGSTIALVLIAYGVLKILPELLDFLDDLICVLKGDRTNERT